MSIWYWGTGPVRTHWRRVLLPAGFALNLWGNTLYETPDRTLGVILFFSGLALAVHGRRPWVGFTEKWHTPDQVRDWVNARRRTSEWVRYEGYLRLTAWGVAAFYLSLYPLKVVDRIYLNPDHLADHASDAEVLLWTWLLLPFGTREAEPKDSPLKRLTGRIWRAVIARTVANTAGICALGVTIYVEVVTQFPAPLLTVAVTLGVAGVVSGHKTWSRLRRLCTQTYTSIQALTRDLEEVHKGGIEKQRAALRSWDAVRLNLQTSIDTGYSFGTPLLPADEVANLDRKVKRTIDQLLGDEDADAKLLVDLDFMQDVCARHIDSVA